MPQNAVLCLPFVIKAPILVVYLVSLHHATTRRVIEYHEEILLE